VRKIRLDLEKLGVDTFETTASEPARGTVRGHWSQVGTCDAFVATCQYGGTCTNGCATKGCTTIQCA
jgi:hypothetical protein